MSVAEHRTQCSEAIAWKKGILVQDRSLGNPLQILELEGRMV